MLRYSDSFDHYSTATIGERWTVAGGSIETNLAHVRTGLQSLRVRAGNAPLMSDLHFLLAFSPPQEVIFGLAYQTDSLDGIIIQTSLAGNPQVYLEINPDGSISAKTGAPAVTLGTSAPGVITAGVFYYIEMKTLVIDNVTGYVTVKVTFPAASTGTTTTVLNVPGVQTGMLGAGIDSFNLGGPSAPNWAYVDDLYVCDTLGGVNDDFLGPVNVFFIKPIADGAPAVIVTPGGGWTPIGGPRFSLVNEVPPDDGVTKIAFTVGFLDISAADGYHYDASGLPGAGWTILGIQGVMDSSYAGPSHPAVPWGSPLFMQEAANPANWTYYAIGPFGPGPFGPADNTWRMAISTFDQNPLTGVDWTLADFATYEFGPIYLEPI